MRQYDHEGDNAPVLIVTHATSQSALTTALADLTSHDAVIGTPVALRIEQI
jgi:homoserine dehydrogenase